MSQCNLCVLTAIKKREKKLGNKIDLRLDEDGWLMVWRIKPDGTEENTETGFMAVGIYCECD